ncbi:hypothetical protein QOZ98_003279 [Planomicrobium stackebrandtii]|uniref:Uncharacterized protein n=1 Tax=Planomicrobium stackebrandtii TaxID=253160 RepID=A0ABU0GYJ7_9BACL|nr:hypothetical protein [Planomicrobium stackebrandtii]MDQ0430422.1 hypothetical protein [Planomicrobium stackebrandtii]
MIRQNRTDGRAIMAGNFMLACFLLGGCLEVEGNLERIHTPEEKTEQDEPASKFVNFQEKEQVEEIDISRAEELEAIRNELIEKFLSHLEEEQWHMVTLKLEDPADVEVPSADFHEPQIAHAVLGKQEHSLNYAWLEINEMNSKFNEVWEKHWGRFVANPEGVSKQSLSVHLEKIQQKYESLLDHIRHVEFKSVTEYAQHLHDYKLYFEGAVLYRIEAALILLEALDTGERVDASVAEAVESAKESEAYAAMCNAELLSYQQSFQSDRSWNLQ